MPDPGDAGWCRRLGVEPGRFVLFVGRLVPENNAHLLVAAHRAMRAGWPLVVVGDAPYAEDYIASLKGGAGPDVRFPGYVFGDGYRELVHRCGIMCVPTEVGGTHPVIVEGMAAGAALVVSDHPPNLEVVGDAAAVFPLDGGADALAAVLDALADDARPPRGAGAPGGGPGGGALQLGRLRRRLPAALRAVRAAAGARPRRRRAGRPRCRPAAGRRASRAETSTSRSAGQSIADVRVVPGEAPLDRGVVVVRAAVRRRRRRR